MSTALANQVPQHIAELMQSGQKFNEDLGPVRASDLGLNIVKLCQSTSREATPGWGPNRNEPPIPVGSMYLSRDHKIIPPGTKFIPLLRDITFIRWVGPVGKGKMEFVTHDPNDIKITQLKLQNGTVVNGLDFWRDHENKTRAPLVTEYQNFYIALGDVDEPVVLSFYRTFQKIGKKFFQSVFAAKQGNKLPMYSLLYQFENPTTINGEGTNSWMGFNITSAGFAPSEAMEKVKTLAQQARILADAASGAEYEGGEDAEEVSTPVSQPAPTIPQVPLTQTVQPINPQTIQQPIQQPVQQAPTQTVIQQPAGLKKLF